RTENYKVYHFDMGGHRYFTKAKEVNQFWFEVLGDDFLLRPRLSRIYYDHKFFAYPIKPFNALAGLGLFQAILISLSYLRSQLFPYQEEETFEQWVSNRFGKRLFSIFFKSYTEKVWGISTSELSAEWAAQRIKGLSMKTAVLNTFMKSRGTVKSLIEEFHYPRRGPGMLWNIVKDKIEAENGQVHLNTTVCGLHRDGNRIESVVVSRDDEEQEYPANYFISSMPVTEFIQKLNPPPPAEVLEASYKLSYRDFLTVCLIVNKPHLFDDNWIYVHDPDVKVGRIQNFKNWSPDMVPDSTKTSLGLEYFCNEGDELWNAPDEELVEMGKKELERIGLARYEDVIDGSVFRVEKAYPVYDSTYSEHLGVIRDYIDTLENFQTIGRNGLHRYNNQDHAMLTGMLAVRNLLYKEKNDLWIVNAEQEYHEEIRDVDLSAHEVEKVYEDVLSMAFRKLDPRAFGSALGLMGGLLLSFATLIVANNGLHGVAAKMLLLGEYFPGYSVTFPGSLVGLFYGILFGFLIGWGFAIIRNAVIIISLAIVHRRAEMQLLRKILDF
ncbi:MAG: NAD(P)/FAD-dependent oxidoreductase, partial [Anaerolineales bacterium]